MKEIFVISLFPEFFKPLYETGVIGSAMRGERGSLPSVTILNPSEYNDKGFKGVDSAPYGGGAGQVLRGDVLEKTLLEGIIKDQSIEDFHIVYLGPRGSTFCQEKAHEFKDLTSNHKNIVFICGRYEGVDERFLNRYVKEHISLGDFVLSGGELALLPVLDAIFRLMPGVLGNEDSPIEESFDGNGLEFPQYTKPRSVCGEDVPDVLMSGHHQKISDWRKEKRLEMTKKYRPDLLEIEKNK